MRKRRSQNKTYEKVNFYFPAARIYLFHEGPGPPRLKRGNDRSIAGIHSSPIFQRNSVFLI